ncbi:lipocalin-like domain-containing protein [Aestuariibaculum marinum]|uniref:Lipocalin family protein n=1 Tax=Aestuariibaculum marinum TaxID=2683592 RepID=A0A8J6Q5K5_9FLAO|nr:lipocalin family protein [Aestuariibaculum marinum]MBD0824769.1 lipocalin family protein [Aestuariibaculum marinum]
MNLLSKLALVLFVSTFVACSSDDEGNFPSENEVPTSAEDINPETSGQEDGIQEGSFSIVGYWVGTGYVEEGETYSLGADDCGEHLTFDNKGIMSENYENIEGECELDETVFGAYTRDGGKLNVFIEGDQVALTIEVTETTLKLSGSDNGEAWTDIFTRID